ncbi:hypothetical protein [Plantibacter sp. CFBP 13570]|uniref:hypothetical protein n=1 Tax=Plantibacter sp. CFBP 13570 TaxID=2775272 RepID=UPI001930A69D|nr:hypothetical protein [Plantibacter sp. CFBP 13570]MBD8535661.1 hypothetical protein [Plantibacter sp. CFBP 13570]
MSGSHAEAEARFRAALAKILVMSPGEFSRSPAAAQMRLDIAEHLVPIVRDAVYRRSGSAFVDETELVNMIEVNFIDQPAKARHTVETSNDAFRYASAIVREWVAAASDQARFKSLGKSWVPRFERIDGPGFDQSALVSASSDPLELMIADEVSPLELAVMMTARTLEHRSPDALRPRLHDIVDLLAHSKYDKSGRQDAKTLECAQATFADVSADRLRAVAAVTWGGRPNRQETSLLGAYFKDPNFQPLQSTAHFRALWTYRRRVNAA